MSEPTAGPLPGPSRTLHGWARTAPSAACVLTPARAVEAGPIWNQQDAGKKCPVAAAAVRGKWTGHWWTTVQGQMSVCQIDLN